MRARGRRIAKQSEIEGGSETRRMLNYECKRGTLLPLFVRTGRWIGDDNHIAGNTHLTSGTLNNVSVRMKHTYACACACLERVCLLGVVG